MKVIFLDIDGVLCIRGCMKLPSVIMCGRRAQAFDPGCVQRLNKIVDATGALIVISSAWRIDYWEPEEFNLLIEYFKDKGVTGKLIGHTPYNNERIRGREIQTWLDEHPDVDKFIIIDDSSDMEHLMPRLVQTTFDDGLQDHHISLAIAMLND